MRAGLGEVTIESLLGDRIILSEEFTTAYSISRDIDTGDVRLVLQARHDPDARGIPSEN